MLSLLHQFNTSRSPFYQDLEFLSLQFWSSLLPDSDQLGMLASISELASLQRICLGNGMNRPKAKEILKFYFPNLKSISLEAFHADTDGAVAMAFWIKHPQIEAISLVRCSGVWFDEEINTSLLPNLRHLEVCQSIFHLFRSL